MPTTENLADRYNIQPIVFVTGRELRFLNGTVPYLVEVADSIDAEVLNERLAQSVVSSKDSQTLFTYRHEDSYWGLNELSADDVFELCNDILHEEGYTMATAGQFEGVYCADCDIVETEGEILHTDDCVECEHCRTQYSPDHTQYGPDHSYDTVYTECGSHFCSFDCAERAGYHLHECGGWYDYPERGDGELLPWDATNPYYSPRDAENPYWVGMEIEKEDSGWIGEAREVAETMEMIAVSDGSLCDYTGFELVTKRYNLTADVAEYNSHFAHSICDADTSSDCGGHITLSKDGLSGQELLSDLGEDFVPLLFALYPKRLRNSYAPPTKKKNEGCTGEKYRAVRIDTDRVEFRIFPQVRNGKQAVWRLALIRLFAQSEINCHEALKNSSHPLYKHLSEVYTDAQIAEKLELFTAFKLWYNDAPLTGCADIERYVIIER